MEQNSQEQLQQAQEALIILKARLFDAEETAKQNGETAQVMATNLVSMFGLDAEEIKDLPSLFEQLKAFAPAKDEALPKA